MNEYGVSAEDVRAALAYSARLVSAPALPLDASDAEWSTSAEMGMEEEARRVGLDPTALSPRGRRLLELRAESAAGGGAAYFLG